MNFPSNLKYTKSHEWGRQDGAKIVVGITEYAQHELSDVVYVELPKIGQEVKQGVACCIVESVKAAFDIYAPISGKIVEINKKLESDPALINRDPYGDGWFFAITPSNVNELNNLMPAAGYEEMLAQGAK
ncbi:MAG: glycine cleavage system protein GcvH [Candidatus Omnitrophica bacterium]|nr:glycine cleavage system protein GcvH [Candidatus Omnitrophota bacterium]